MKRRSAIKVEHANLGNQMFRYMLAKTLQNRVPDVAIVNAHMPVWNISQSEIDESEYRVVDTGFGQEVDIHALEGLLKTDANVLIKLNCYAQRFEYYADNIDYFRELFSSDVNGLAVDDDELLINVRTGDILGGYHHDYVPIPVYYYVQLLKWTGLRPVFVGQIEESWYTARLRELFPTARFVGGSPIEDFQTIRQARNVAISVSSFAWLAAWLSTRAERIYMPLLGIFNQSQRHDVNLVPQGDKRYSFTEFPIMKYNASESQKRSIVAASNPMSWG